MASDLDGVSLVFANAKCTYSLAELAAGVSIGFELRIAHSYASLHPVSSDLTGCQLPDDSGFIVNYDIAGGTQEYCLCDQGFCSRPVFTTSAQVGTYASHFGWDGRNWQGRSDTFQPEGAAFPPGAYVLAVFANGTWDGPGASDDGGTASGDAGTPGDSPLQFRVSAMRNLTITR